MPAYLLYFRDDVTDPAALATYGDLVTKTFEGHNVIVRAAFGRHEVLEGRPLQGAVVLEFPTLEAARSWYYSPQYQAIIGHRLGASTGRSVIVEGV